MKVDRSTPILASLIRISMISVLLISLVLIGFIFTKGVARLNLEMSAWEYNSNDTSMTLAITSAFNMALSALAPVIPLGIFGVIYLSEYGSKKSKVLDTVRIASETLTGIPSIVYGLFGYLAFVLYFGFKTSLVAGGLTLTVMILPLVLRSVEEVLKSVPLSFGEASFALGARKLRITLIIILLVAIPGILVGVILSIDRMVGESTALPYISGSVAKVVGLMDLGRTLSAYIYAISSEGRHINKAYSTAMILIIIAFLINPGSNYLVEKLVKA